MTRAQQKIAVESTPTFEESSPNQPIGEPSGAQGDNELRGKEDVPDQRCNEMQLIENVNGVDDPGSVADTAELEDTMETLDETVPTETDNDDRTPAPPADPVSAALLAPPDVLTTTPTKLRELQQQDSSLAKAREVAQNSQYPRPADRVYFFYRDGLLYRSWRPSGTDEEEVRRCDQLVLPQACRSTVLRLTHDIPLAGHLGVPKTKD